MAQIQASHYLKVGVDQNSELWGYRDPSTGQLQGFDIDMVDQVAAAIFGADWPAHIEPIIVANANRISAVQSGQVDLVAETMTITCDRKKDVDFSAEYYDAYQTVLVPNGSPIKSLANLAGRKVCATDQSTSLQHLAYYVPKATLVSVANQTDCLVMLQQGQVDAISTDDTILEGLAKQDPNVHLVSGITRGTLSDEPYGMAISKAHPEFTQFVNAVLKQEMSDGQWASIWNANLSKVPGLTLPTPPPAYYTSSLTSSAP
jgi:polar amino acid transport system substrate-binding protein